MRRLIPFAVFIAILAAACADSGTDSTEPQVPESSANAPVQAGGATAPPEVLACADAPRIEAPADSYRDTPVYVGNEMPIEEVQAWASAYDGHEASWIDRDHNGWITIAFSRDAERRQAELPSVFPGVGVVVVDVDWTMSELEDLQRRVTEVLAPEVTSFGTGVSVTEGLVSIDVGVLTDEIRALVEAEFGGERVCLSGIDPAAAPAPGPQPQAGDGWRLLLDAAGAGYAYRTGIATDARTLTELWETLGIDATVPAVDFESEVAIWFGAVFGSGCENIRLDGVVVAGDTVHADIVLVDPPAMCPSDANPHAYVVAVDRSLLPAGPFHIQLDADGPPRGVPEERTFVEADLTVPGSVARAEDLSQGSAPPPDPSVQSGDFLEPDIAYPYSLYLHCGHEWLGEFNGFNWRTDDPAPAVWSDLIGGFETVEAEIVLSEGPDPEIVLVALDAAVVYRPTADPAPGCD